MDPKLMFWCVSVQLEQFGCNTNLSGKRAELVQSSCHEVASEFFATSAPDPPHCNPSSCFGAFHTVWVHLGLLGSLTKLSATRAELMQKFVP